MEPPRQRKNEAAKAERIRNGNAFYAVLLCLSLICAVACNNEKTPQEESADPDEFCLSTDVSSTSEDLIITNTGDRSWGHFGALLIEGPHEDIDSDSKNDFLYESENKVMPPATTVTIPWNKFVRDDGLRFDPAKYAFKGISVTAFGVGRGLHFFGGFSTTEKMARDDRGVYLNRCKQHHHL
jgi:hypothetical protein